MSVWALQGLSARHPTAFPVRQQLEVSSLGNSQLPHPEPQKPASLWPIFPSRPWGRPVTKDLSGQLQPLRCSWVLSPLGGVITPLHTRGAGPGITATSATVPNLPALAGLPAPSQ